MGLVKFGGGVAGISGKVGGTVYARNGAGAIARNWVKPTNPASPSQTGARTRFGNQSNGWSELSGAERDAWNADVLGLSRLNRLGESYQPKGRQIFMEANNNLALIEQALLTDPPVDFIPPSIGAVKALGTVVAGVLTTLDGIDFGAVVGMYTVVEASPQMPNSKVNQTLNFRYIGVTTNDGTPDLLAMWTAVYGSSAVVGNVITFRISNVFAANGMRSAAVVYASVLEV